jgi:hypothetical protein
MTPVGATGVLPHTIRYIFDDAFDQRGGDMLEFRLIYQGPLHSDGRTKEKHLIRKQFHGQLTELWRVHPFLSWADKPHSVYGDRSYLQQLADQYARLGYRFVPLIQDDGKGRIVTCELDILFLRRDNPGYLLLRGGGDIDNRIKTLFDGLKMPDCLNDLGGFDNPAADEDPFFVLVQDDKLITALNVTTDRLVLPPDRPQYPHDVVLIVHVTAKLMNAGEFFP